ncbi:unnamed protein product [Linum tenue]|nr:unnamed protein product [Linum tenue]
MVIMTYVASLYLLVLRTFPGSIFLHKFIDKRLVLSLLVIATMVGIIFNGAALHLLVTLAATTPLVLVHASMWIGEDAMVAAAGDKEAADFLPVVQQESQQGSR